MATKRIRKNKRKTLRRKRGGLHTDTAKARVRLGNLRRNFLNGMRATGNIWEESLENKEERHMYYDNKIYVLDKRYANAVIEIYRKYRLNDELAKMTDDEMDATNKRDSFNFDVVKVTREVINLNKEYKDSSTSKETAQICTILFNKLMPLQIQLSFKLDSEIAEIKKKQDKIGQSEWFKNKLTFLESSKKVLDELKKDADFPRSFASSIYNSVKHTLFGRRAQVAKPNNSSRRIEGNKAGQTVEQNEQNGNKARQPVEQNSY